MDNIPSLRKQRSRSQKQVAKRNHTEGFQSEPQPRPQVKGRFFASGEEKTYLKGVTYGTFAPDENGDQFPAQDVVRRDFHAMVEHGFNTVRTYTVPPKWLLDEAALAGLWVMLGVPWEQHITFLEGRSRGKNIIQRAKAQLSPIAAHPAILAYTIGNEIPSPIVRWHGAKKVERFLKKFYRAVKSIDPEGLVTYVNYPTTEYLNLPFLDFVAFNVFLETREQLESYLARLHNLAEERPLILTEVGLDSQRHGEETQAESVEWQIRLAFESGCSGAFAFSWTDEWYRGGHDILDWDFGLTRRDRSAKPALQAVSRAMQDAPLPATTEFPKVSVVVCCYNEAQYLGETLEHLGKLSYPNYEVIVVNDGSTDGTLDIAQRYPCTLISTENKGLSNARNIGAKAATGDIVAYIDGDAYPDPHWLHYLVHTFQEKGVQAVGGPNIMPLEDGAFSECIAHSPGGPAHVLFSDSVAEHVPGCNMAFLKSCLDEIHGFDPQFRAAGDDVDICWRIMERGWTIGFHPSAIVWHHRRCTLSRYWKQQKGYGKAEALLERKWPEKYNRFGHIPWSGRIYARGLTRTLLEAPSRIYQGTWGLAPFQSLYKLSPTNAMMVPLTPEWFLTSLFLAGVSTLGIFWAPLLWALPLFFVSISLPAIQSLRSAITAPLTKRRSFMTRQGMRILIAYMHMVQPMARLCGRVRNGLTLWRRRGPKPNGTKVKLNQEVWSENWHGPEKWLGDLESYIRDQGAVYVRGGDYDDWDLNIYSGMFGAAKVKMTLEEHGSGKQLAKFKARSHIPCFKLALTAVSYILTLFASIADAMVPAIVLGAWTLIIVFKEAKDNQSVLYCFTQAVNTLREIMDVSPTVEEKDTPDLEEEENDKRHLEDEAV